MILFPLLALGGHLLSAAVAQVTSAVPELNYEPICQDSASIDLGLKDDRAICMQDEAQARAELTRKWSTFGAAGRSSCLRLSSTNRTGSYVELLTCLEMDRDARALTKGADLGIGAAAPPPTREVDPVRTGQVARRAPPVALAAPEAKPSSPAAPTSPTPGFLSIFCPPGLSSVLPNCRPSGP
ncbi:MAG TPA: hypothetical protein VKW08_13855 [Xanthobacteraceae bacterium]|nr:hypothetical protein [Xanthobacteraceae bacterium]